MEIAGHIATWFLIFLTYSVAGWCIEVFLGVVMQHKIVNRGFLIGPVCPIYGIGALLMSLLLRNTTNLVEVFLVSFLAGAVLEYTTSFLMEKLFRVRWWDYTDEKFNIRGRICLKYLLCFGVLGLIIMSFTNPALLIFYNSISVVPRVAAAIILFALLLSDFGISLWLINNCRVTVGTLQRDATEEISMHIREVMLEKGKLNRRLAKAFPQMQAKQKTRRKNNNHSKTKSTHPKSTSKTTSKPARKQK